jgi:HPr kinase/phosphorylase
LAEDGLLIHATCVALGGQGVLIMGPPGSGKSDLALRLIDSPGRGVGTEPLPAELVSDDQTLITRQGDRLFGSAAQGIAGKLEIRGIGIVDVAHQPSIALALAVRLAPASGIERMPASPGPQLELLGMALPEITVDAASPSAPARIRAALGHLGEV